MLCRARPWVSFVPVLLPASFRGASFRGRLSALVFLMGASAGLLGLGAGDHGPPLCLIRLVLGIPCPSCGMSRGVAALLHGDLAGASHQNPAAVPVALSALVLCLLFPIELCGQHRTLERLWARPGVRKLCAAAAVLLMAAAWAVNLWRHFHGGGPVHAGPV